MSGNEQTPNELTTQPTLETVLERINAVAGSIGQLRTVIANDITQLRTDVDQRFDTLVSDVAQLRADVDRRFNAVDGEIANLRKDVERGFRGFERKIGYLAKDFMERREEVEELEARVESLENKAS